MRRSKAAAKEKTAAQVEALDQARTKDAQKWCSVICDWIEDEGFSGAYGEQIVDETRRELTEAEKIGRVPQGKPPAAMPVGEIIKRCKPIPVKDGEISEIAWYAAWLARWICFAISDTVTRDRALGLALNRQIAGETAI